MELASRFLRRLLRRCAAGEYQPSASEAELGEQLDESEHIGARISDIAMQLTREFEALAPQITQAVQQPIE